MLKIWNEYIKHLKSISIDFPIQLNPPLAESGLETINIEKNNQLLLLLSIFNGQNSGYHPVLFGFRFLTTNEIIERYKSQSEQVNVPFAIDSNNNYLLIDKCKNTVYFENNRELFFIAQSIYDLIATLIDHIEFGFFVFDKTGLSCSIDPNIPFPISLHNELKDQLVVNKDSLFHHLKSNLKIWIPIGFRLIEEGNKSLQYKIDTDRMIFSENRWNFNSSFYKKYEETETCLTISSMKFDEDFDTQANIDGILNNFKQQKEIFLKESNIEMNFQYEISDTEKQEIKRLELKYGLYNSENTFIYFITKKYSISILIDHVIHKKDLEIIQSKVE